jgi:hypothetical protein
LLHNAAPQQSDRSSTMQFDPSQASTSRITYGLPAVILTFGVAGFIHPAVWTIAAVAGVVGASVWLAELQRRSIDIPLPCGFIGS